MFLLALNPYVDAILALALAWLSLRIVQALFGPLYGIPAVGHYIEAAVTYVAQSISDACGQIASGVSVAVGTTLHGIARTVDWSYGEFRRHANLLLGIASFLPPLAYAIAALRAGLHSVASSNTGATARLGRLEKEYRGIEAQVKQLEREFHGIDETGIRKQIAKLNNRVETLNRDTIPDIRGQIATDEGAFAGLEQWLGIKNLTTYTDWAAGIVAAGLGLSLFNLFKCNTFLNKVLGRGCGLWSGLENLFGLFIDAIALTHLCDLPLWIDEFFSPLLGDLTGLISSAANSLCAAFNPDWAPLDVPNGPLPPPQSLYIPTSFS